MPRIRPVDGFIYLMQARHYFKIGASTDPEVRAELILKGGARRPHDMGDTLTVIWKLWVADYLGVERALQAHFDNKSYLGEWFLLSQEEVDWITSQTEETLRALPEYRLKAKAQRPQRTPPSSTSAPQPSPHVIEVRPAESSLSVWGRVDCLLDHLIHMIRYAGPRDSDFMDVSMIQMRSGIPQATFWRLVGNKNTRIGLEGLARCCATLQVDISELLLYRNTATTCVWLPIPEIIPHTLIDPGHIEVVLGQVLDGYAAAFGEPLTNLADIIQLPTQRHRVQAMIAGTISQIDLPILERTICILTEAAGAPTPPARQFDTWLRERGYTPGTVGLMLKYVPPTESRMQRSAV
jgi:DNA-binding Xre family transcriptional regulator